MPALPAGLVATGLAGSLVLSAWPRLLQAVPEGCEHPRDVARLLLPAWLMGSVCSALLRPLLPEAAALTAPAAGLVLAWLVLCLLCRQRKKAAPGRSAAWLVLPLAPLHLSLFLLQPATTINALAQCLLFALALLCLIPAFSILQRRLLDSELPACMRGQPASILAAGLFALGLKGVLQWL